MSFYYFDEFNHLKTLLFVLNLEKIKYLIDYPVVRKTMSLAARKFGLKFGPKLAKAITNVYESIFLKKYIGI